MDKIILTAFALFFGAIYFYMSGQPTPIENPPAALAKGPTLVYFGTRDCPACRSFVRGGGLRQMEDFARANRVPFVVKEIDSLRDLRKDGAFGEFTSAWRATAGKSGRFAVPSFAFVRDGAIIDAEAGNWHGILRKAAEDIKG